MTPPRPTGRHPTITHGAVGANRAGGCRRGGPRAQCRRAERPDGHGRRPARLPGVPGDPPDGRRAVRRPVRHAVPRRRVLLRVWLVLRGARPAGRGVVRRRLPARLRDVPACCGRRRGHPVSDIDAADELHGVPADHSVGRHYNLPAVPYHTAHDRRPLRQRVREPVSRLVVLLGLRVVPAGLGRRRAALLRHRLPGPLWPLPGWRRPRLDRPRVRRDHHRRADGPHAPADGIPHRHRDHEHPPALHPHHRFFGDDGLHCLSGAARVGERPLRGRVQHALPQQPVLQHPRVLPRRWRRFGMGMVRIPALPGRLRQVLPGALRRRPRRTCLLRVPRPRAHHRPRREHHGVVRHAGLRGLHLAAARRGQPLRGGPGHAVPQQPVLPSHRVLLQRGGLAADDQHVHRLVPARLRQVPRGQRNGGPARLPAFDGHRRAHHHRDLCPANADAAPDQRRDNGERAAALGVAGSGQRHEFLGAAHHGDGHRVAGATDARDHPHGGGDDGGGPGHHGVGHRGRTAAEVVIGSRRLTIQSRYRRSSSCLFYYAA